MLYRVIIVDDEPFIREGIKKLISWDELGLEIIGCAADGAKALEMLDRESADICITDIRMPHMDGLELMQRCKDTGKNMKYIVLSGYTDFELVKRAAQIGIENYIVKPVDRMELSQTLVSVVDKLNSEQTQQAVLQEGIDILRENLLYRWITGEITPEELAERKEYLGVELTSEYAVGILKMTMKSEIDISVSDIKKMKRDALERLKNFASKQEKIICVPAFNGNLILLIQDVVKSRRQIDNALMKLIRYGECEQKFRCFIAMGDIETNKQIIDKSYFSARHVLENYEFSSEKSIIWYQETGQYMDFVPEECYDRLWQITDKFSINDKKEVFNLVDGVMNDIGKMPGMRLEVIQAFGVILVSRVLQNVKNYRPNTEQKIESLLMMTMGIYHIQRLEDVIIKMKQIIEEALIVSTAVSVAYSSTVFNVINYIENNFDKDICLKMVSNVFHMNAVYLGRIFNQETGNTFNEYLNLLRMKKACDLLKNTDFPIKQISKMVGYQNSNYFYTLFKKSMGVTPAEFRSGKN